MPHSNCDPGSLSQFRFVEAVRNSRGWSLSQGPLAALPTGKAWSEAARSIDKVSDTDCGLLILPAASNSRFGGRDQIGIR